jgi:hypothetical protein
VAVEPQQSSAKRLVRRLLTPFASPIDGRVADINRRITETREGGDRLAGRVAQLEMAVASFAEASTESTSYVGVELGRIGGELSALQDSVAEFGRSIDRLGERSREEHHRRRLVEAADLSLAELDGTLAGLLNHAAGHRGFAAQAELWFNPPVTVELSEGAARLTGVNERIVEVPFATAALGRLPTGARILDVGSAESTFPLSAASLGYQVTAVDPRGLSYSHPNLRTVAATVENLPAPPPTERFDAMFLISTIEHVGLPAYGVTPHGEVLPGAGADLELLDRARDELLADDGIVVITTPYGRRGVTDFERTYDDDSLTHLLEGWEVLERVIVSQSQRLVWTVAQADAPLGDPGVAMVVARPLVAG